MLVEYMRCVNVRLSLSKKKSKEVKNKKPEECLDYIRICLQTYENECLMRQMCILRTVKNQVYDFVHWNRNVCVLTLDRQTTSKKRRRCLYSHLLSIFSYYNYLLRKSRELNFIEVKSYDTSYVT